MRAVDNRDVYRERWCAEDYDSDRFGGPFGRYLHDREVEAFDALIEARDGWILDAGAGTGKLSLTLARKLSRVVSVDSSAEMLAIARRKAQREALALKAVVCDVHQLCFPDKAFDCVICSRVLMHVADWEQAVSELCRVSRAGVVLDFPPSLSFAGLHGPLRRLGTRFANQARGYRVFRIGKVIHELERHGFEVVVVRKGFFLPIALHRWLDRPAVSLAVERLLAGLGLRTLFGAPVLLKASRTDHDTARSSARGAARSDMRALDPA